jgi:hypothetical protein
MLCLRVTAEILQSEKTRGDLMKPMHCYSSLYGGGWYTSEETYIPGTMKLVPLVHVLWIVSCE